MICVKRRIKDAAAPPRRPAGPLGSSRRTRRCTSAFTRRRAPRPRDTIFFPHHCPGLRRLPLTASTSPRRSPTPPRPRQLYGTEQHGMSVMLGGGVDELLEQNPDVLVILQGANDPARDSLANYEMRFKEFVGAQRAQRCAALGLLFSAPRAPRPAPRARCSVVSWRDDASPPWRFRTVVAYCRQGEGVEGRGEAEVPQSDPHQRADAAEQGSPVHPRCLLSVHHPSRCRVRTHRRL